MKKDELKRLTGFDSFLECFQWLKRDKLDNKISIKVVKEAGEVMVFGKPIKVEAEEKFILISEIKAEALEEIYSALPTRDDKAKINQSLGVNLQRWQFDELNQIINKIPTK